MRGRSGTRESRISSWDADEKEKERPRLHEGKEEAGVSGI